jgi:hypothetical protein
MKKVFSFLSITLLLLLIQVSSVWAATFTVSAHLDPATGVAITASSVNTASKVFTNLGSSTSLSFNPLTFNTANSIWLPDHYFAIDVAPAGGGGTVDTTVGYGEGANPNSASTGHGLGWKSTATFIKVVGTQENGLTAHGPKKMLKDVSGEHITFTEMAGGYLRIYVGIVSKDPAATYPDPTLSEPFTNVDKSGDYNGTLTITATAV